MKTPLLFLSLLAVGSSYKILCIFPAPTRSHNILANGIVDSLLKAGHEVTWVSPYPDNKVIPNRRVISVETAGFADGFNMTALTTPIGLIVVKELAKNLTRTVLATKEVREVLMKEQFDAVITEWFFSEMDAGYAAVQKVPWIVLFGSVIQSQMEATVDDVRSIATLPVPYIFPDFGMPMTMWQRTVNYIVGLGLSVSARKEIIDVMSPFYDTMFTPFAKARGVTLPPLLDTVYNISVLFVNSHPSIAPTRSLPPNVVDIAGYHIDENIPPLPKDLQDLLDASTQGVVYFSMGSVLKPAMILGAMKDGLLKTLGSIPYTVLWKFNENIQGLPKNVHVRSWFPQSSILAHPNTKLFITHGGQLSSLEAIYHGVPVLSIPVYGDQPSNAERAVTLGIGLKVPYSETMIPELKEKLNILLNNDRYYKKVKELSKLFRSRPVWPSKLISHYVEVAIESKGAFHLRSTTYLYAWYERWMLDVWAVIIILIIFFYMGLKALLRYLKSKFFGTKTVDIKKKKK